MTTHWHIMRSDRIYGPYDLERLTHFAQEGRLTKASLVAPAPEGPWALASATPALGAVFDATHGHRFARAAESGEAHMCLYLENNSGRSLDGALQSLGAYAFLAPSMVALRTRESAGKVRHVLAQALGPGDRLLVVDATRNRAAWHNIGPEAEAKFRQVWTLGDVTRPPAGSV